jgi:hypothetical protein
MKRDDTLLVRRRPASPALYAINSEVQRAHARLYNLIESLRDEFQADNLPVEEALAILALELISVDYAARYRPDLLRKKLAAVPRAKDRLLERRAIELAERKGNKA